MFSQGNLALENHVEALKFLILLLYIIDNQHILMNFSPEKCLNLLQNRPFLWHNATI